VTALTLLEVSLICDGSEKVSIGKDWATIIVRKQSTICCCAVWASKL